MKSIIEIKNLSVSFDGKKTAVKALDNVNLTLDHQEVLAVLGESGSGKSVLCKAILGILPKNAEVTSGEILFDGEDILKLSEKQLNLIRGKKLAMIFQEPLMSLNPAMSIGKQIAEAAAMHKKLSKKDAKQRALELMELCGIDNPKMRYFQYPHQFSGGLAQRAVIAIALAADPSVLIADEPTTSLDIRIQSGIISLLKDLQKKTGISVMFITHDISVASSVAQRACIMSRGRLIEEGTLENIINAPLHQYTKSMISSAKLCGIIDTDKYQKSRAV